jgi:hypothetical protein
MNTGCSEYPGTSFRSIEGNSFNYQIPEQLVRKTDATLYRGEISGDESKTTTLLLPQEAIHNDNLKTTDGLSLLLFWGKDYQQAGGIRSVANKMLKDAQYKGEMKGVQHYQSASDEQRQDYFINFPLSDGTNSPNRYEYIIQVIRHSDIEIGGIKTEAKPLCIMQTIYDGISIRLSGVGSACQVTNFNTLSDLIVSKMQDWQVLKR